TLLDKYQKEYDAMEQNKPKAQNTEAVDTTEKEKPQPKVEVKEVPRNTQKETSPHKPKTDTQTTLKNNQGNNKSKTSNKK
ncbi:MAG: hypothetical protein QXU40_04470, partial [Candidatus Pacearchaeota archaeon]